MQTDLIQEARRQAEVCNACRYCEGYCSVFPALHAKRAFSDGDITQLANLCHNCRGCYYACQYTAPHEFALNLPQALADVRVDSWESHAWPGGLGKIFQRNGVPIALAALIGFALLFMIARAFGEEGGERYYSVVSHGLLVAIFAPAFLFPLFAIGVGLRDYWKTVGGEKVRLAHVTQAFGAAANMKNLKGGHGDGCNFEDEDRFSHARRAAHQLTMYGFLLCFAATCSGTILHYVFDIQGPHGLFSLPKLFGLPGGVLLAFGTAWMASLKLKSDPELAAQNAWSGEMAFILLLFFIAMSGLALFVAGSSAVMPTILALHLGAVLAFFLLTPYTKMAHGFYRLAALVRDAQSGR
ncbi:tricarballylate utilization 4Fe-4S protein TcuB [Pacificoceanicola onchidii]|uniref:tricarballylate utilization 4Fe-4S protein TcuB n=1 Tax=Pacificoceanicola onchidii TaxID=2562685 RepID=UPI0010A4898B|nr:tricarballylate utilization 4Fe-4S protein TcuB [Pacificoceanicola onchidii]